MVFYKYPSWLLSVSHYSYTQPLGWTLVHVQRDGIRDGEVLPWGVWGWDDRILGDGLHHATAWWWSLVCRTGGSLLGSPCPAHIVWLFSSLCLSMPPFPCLSNGSNCTFGNLEHGKDNPRSCSRSRRIQVDFYRKIWNYSLPPKKCLLIHFSYGKMQLTPKRQSGDDIQPHFGQGLLPPLCLVVLSWHG